MSNISDYLSSKADTIVNYSLFIIIIAIIIYIAYNVITHYRFLDSQEDDFEIDTEYASILTFKKNLKYLIKYSIRKYVKYYKFVLHYIHFYIIKSLSFLQYIINLIYSKLRNNFVEKSIGDKKYVAHFWGNLKEFKKEMDKE